MLEHVLAEVELPGAILEQLTGDPGGDLAADPALDGHGDLLDARPEPDAEINLGVLATYKKICQEYVHKSLNCARKW